MPSHNILITGASGYLGGTLLARWETAHLPAHGKLFALVRTEAQAEAVRRYNAEPLNFDSRDETAVRRGIVDNRITIVYFLINALDGEAQVHFIRALAEVKQLTGQEVHFLHTSGAKLFSSHADAPSDRPLLDTEPGLYAIQKAQMPSFPIMKTAVGANCTVIEETERCGVRGYIFAPCTVYGKGEGFGNVVSNLTVLAVKAGRSLGRVYKVDEGRLVWPVCHVIDNTNLYLDILRKILKGDDPGHGKQGYFLASSGSVAWDDLYAAMAVALAKRGLVDDTSVILASQEVLQSMGEAAGCSPEFVAVMFGGQCTFTPEHGKAIGWRPQFHAEHILETADEEVQLILDNLPA